MMTERPGEGPLKPSWERRAEAFVEPAPSRYVAPSPFGGTGAQWHCTGVLQKTLKLHGSEHDLPIGIQPDDNTTDAAGKWRFGFCSTCGKRTVWKAL